MAIDRRGIGKLFAGSGVLVLVALIPIAATSGVPLGSWFAVGAAIVFGVWLMLDAWPFGKHRGAVVDPDKPPEPPHTWVQSVNQRGGITAANVNINQAEQPEFDVDPIERNQEGPDGSFMTTFVVRVLYTAALRRIRLVAAARTTTPLRVRDLRGPLSLGARPLVFGGGDHMLLEFDNPPRQFAVDVWTPEPDDGITLEVTAL